MKEKIGIILLILVLVIIGVFLGFIVISKQNLPKENFNIKKGDIINFDEKDVTLTVLNVASTICNKKECFSEGEIEVSLKVLYNNETTYYTLKNISNKNARIENSNYYIVLKYLDEKIILDVVDKNEI